MAKKKSVDNTVVVDENGVTQKRPEDWEYLPEPGALVRLLGKGHELYVPRCPIKQLHNPPEAEGGWLTGEVTNHIEYDDIATVLEVHTCKDGSPVARVAVGGDSNRVGWVYTFLIQPLDDWRAPLPEDLVKILESAR